MRNKNRIPVILETLEEIWMKSPDLRFGQLIYGINESYFKDRDTFNVEDDEFQEVLFEINKEPMDKEEIYLVACAEIGDFLNDLSDKLNLTSKSIAVGDMFRLEAIIAKFIEYNE